MKSIAPPCIFAVHLVNETEWSVIGDDAEESEREEARIDIPPPDAEEDEFVNVESVSVKKSGEERKSVPPDPESVEHEVNDEFEMEREGYEDAV